MTGAEPLTVFDLIGIFQDCSELKTPNLLVTSHSGAWMVTMTNRNKKCRWKTDFFSNVNINQTLFLELPGSNTSHVATMQYGHV